MSLTLGPIFRRSFYVYILHRVLRALPAHSGAYPKELKAQDDRADNSAWCLGEALKALILPHKAPVVTDISHMGDPVILPFKAAPGFDGGANHIAPRCTLEPAIHSLGISPTVSSCEAWRWICTIKGRAKSFEGGRPTTLHTTQTSALHSRQPLNHQYQVSSFNPCYHLVTELDGIPIH